MVTAGPPDGGIRSGAEKGFWERNVRYFDSPVQRRGRLLGRLLVSALTPRMYPRAPVARAFWFDQFANFGDGLTPWLLRRAGVIPILAPPETARLVGVGSILELMPEDFDGYIWGSGSLRGAPIHLPAATILAVRGELTRDLLDAGRNVALGDPGILVSRYLRRRRPRWRVGVVPHHMHRSDRLWSAVKAASPEEVTIIDVAHGPGHVVREIARCESVITTSLHGLITADAFGIPAAWTRREPDLWGGQFKFRDYESVLTPGRTRLVDIDSRADFDHAARSAGTVDAHVLRRRQDGLLAALDLAVELPRSSPLAAWRQVRPRPVR